MYEVEVKVPAALDAVRDRLEALGADRNGVVVQEDTYYDAPHRSFVETDEALRIRRESKAESGAEETKITYKGPLVDQRSKTREEVETGVESAAAVDAILTNLGFDAAATVRKERERFSIDGYTVTLDAVDGVGEYVEVETEVEVVGEEDEVDPEERNGEADAEERNGLESAREGAFDLVERLGLDPDEQVRTSYLGLLLEGAE